MHHTYKIGLDLHGVLDAKPEFFSFLSKLFTDNGHEVHILTGPSDAQPLKDELKRLNISYTHIFSITDYCKRKGLDICYDDLGNPHMDPYYWDRAKAEYCILHQIDLHLDDSDAYCYFFKTPYARFYSKNTKRIQKMDVIHAKP